jgi:hypothetical protein
MVAKLVANYVEQFEDGKLWSRRYAEQLLPNTEDVEHWWQYCALNPVISGLGKKISDYRSYNSVFDAIKGKTQSFQVFERWKYNEKLRKGSKANKKNFIKTHTLHFERLPGYEKLPDDEYRSTIFQRLESRRQLEIENRLKEGKGFAPAPSLRKTNPGSKPKSTKTSSIDSFRPIILTLCRETLMRELDFYFDTKRQHKEASIAFMAGELNAIFPPGTYRPPSFKA